MQIYGWLNAIHVFVWDESYLELFYQFCFFLLAEASLVKIDPNPEFWATVLFLQGII